MLSARGGAASASIQAGTSAWLAAPAPTRRIRSRGLPRSGAASVGDAGSVASTSDADRGATLITLQEVQQVAKLRGIELTVRDLGPFYRIVAREAQGSRVLGVTSGFVAPLFGIMHCDMLQIFTRGLQETDGQRVRGGPLGVGLLLGGATFAYGHEQGCRVAEILAINDNDAWNERLVRYYSFFGFTVVQKVGGNGLADVPHMLVWGGEGTRMDAEIAPILTKWTPALRRKQ